MATGSDWAVGEATDHAPHNLLGWPSFIHFNLVKYHLLSLNKMLRLRLFCQVDFGKPRTCVRYIGICWKYVFHFFSFTVKFGDLPVIQGTSLILKCIMLNLCMSRIRRISLIPYAALANQFFSLPFQHTVY